MVSASGLLCLFALVVGHESVLAVSSSRELHCGRRLVSGLFSRPRLPLGYSYVTTVPRGACRLNVSEIMPSDNYIALKISNGSYIMNGEFAVSTPGTYEAAGARFVYTRQAGQDSIFAHGPTHHPIDIMILYTQPNPSIKYEYFTESLPGEIESESITKSDFTDVTPTPTSKHIRRHHSYDAFSRAGGASKHSDVSRETVSAEDNLEENIVGTRKFVWKILSYTQCTRSCGGGIQLGKFRCVEANAGDREVSGVHCSGSAPAPRRRRCGSVQCPPRWRAAAWSACPKCGPATKHRIVGCVQDHARGITKISDQKCPAPKPPSTENCDVPNCNDINSGEVRIGSRRTLRPREHTDTFRAGPVYSVAVNSTDLDVGPEYSFSATAGWLYTNWSECVGWCVGGGVQSRGVRCADPSGCTPRKAPDTFRTCTPKITCEPLEGSWFTGEWSPCSGCGGKQIRGVLCIGGSGRHLKDSACRAPKPPTVKDCETDCLPTWYYSDWGECISNCSSSTSFGSQRRSVVCARGDDASPSEQCSSTPAPQAQRECEATCETVVVTTSAPTSAFTVESQKALADETPSTQRSTTRSHILTKGCKDKLNNCALAVQARLCHYNYYTQNCCYSCAGR